MCVCARACVRVRMCVCVCEWVCVRVCVLGGGGGGALLPALSDTEPPLSLLLVGDTVQALGNQVYIRCQSRSQVKAVHKEDGRPIDGRA